MLHLRWVLKAAIDDCAKKFWLEEEVAAEASGGAREKIGRVRWSRRVNSAQSNDACGRAPGLGASCAASPEAGGVDARVGPTPVSAPRQHARLAYGEKKPCDRAPCAHKVCDVPM